MTTRSREFCSFLDGTGKIGSEKSTGTGTGTGKFPAIWYQGIFHFLGGTGIGTGKKWSRKKVPVPVRTGKDLGYCHTLVRLPVDCELPPFFGHRGVITSSWSFDSLLSTAVQCTVARILLQLCPVLV